MPMVSVSLNEVAPGESLPFDIYDAKGRLLLRATSTPSLNTLEGYLRKGIFTTETQFAAWKRRLAGHLHQMLNEPDITLADLIKSKAKPVSVYEPVNDSLPRKKIQKLEAAVEETSTLLRLLQRDPRLQAEGCTKIIAQIHSNLIEANEYAIFYTQFIANTNERHSNAALALLVALLAHTSIRDFEGDQGNAAIPVELLFISIAAASCALLAGQNIRAMQFNSKTNTNTFQTLFSGIQNIYSISLEEYTITWNSLSNAMFAAMKFLQNKNRSWTAEKNIQHLAYFSSSISIDKSMTLKMLEGLVKRYPELLPGQLVTLPSKQIGIVVYTATPLSDPIIIRLINSKGTPLSEPLLAKLTHDDIQKIEPMDVYQINMYVDMTLVAECASRGLKNA